MDSLTDANNMASYASPSANRATATAGAGYEFWGKDGFTFDDILDVINPLQQLPIISTLYREMTGDDIAPGARIIGGGLFGGVAGVFAAVFNTIIEDSTGSDLGEHVMALFDGDAVAPPTGEPTPAVTTTQESGSGRDDWMIVGAASTYRDIAWRQTASVASQSLPVGLNDLDAASIAAWRGEAHGAEQNTAATIAPEAAGDGTPDAALCLTAMPVVEDDYIAGTVEPMTPATVKVLFKAAGRHAAEADIWLHEAVERYQQATVVEKTRLIVDNLI